jgi:hypothetical protein
MLKYYVVIACALKQIYELNKVRVRAYFQHIDFTSLLVYLYRFHIFFPNHLNGDSFAALPTGTLPDLPELTLPQGITKKVEFLDTWRGKTLQDG